jgi:hypothetical protein
MKDLKHTKGNWEFNGHRQVVFQDAERYKDCDLWDVQYEDKEEMIANAKLISASPDLIKAALYALDLLGHNENNYAVGEGNIKDACKELEAAIKKATE